MEHYIITGSVTIIIAAYQRVDALNLTIRSVCQQQYTKWRLLIVADCCSQDFLNQIDDSDPRVKVINLSHRCGNQYGPNSIGIHLAQSDYIAFLNHDDLWLSDHLTIALETMAKQNANFFMGTAAFCHHQNQHLYINQKRRLLFSEKNRPHAIWGCIKKKNAYFEPCSTIVIDTALAKKAGYWRSPGEVKDSPLLDWIRRVMKCNATYCFSDKVSTLKFNLHHTNNFGGNYSENNFLEFLPHFLQEDLDTLRQHVEEDLNLAEERGLVRREELTESTHSKDESQDIIDFLNFLNNREKESKSKRGKNEGFFLKVVESRTGEKLHRFKSSEEIIVEFDRDQKFHR